MKYFKKNLHTLTELYIRYELNRVATENILASYASEILLAAKPVGDTVHTTNTFNHEFTFSV